VANTRSDSCVTTKWRVLIKPDGFDQVTFGITLEYHFSAVAVLITADNDFTLLDTMHLWTVEAKTICFLDCSAWSANLMLRTWVILIAIVAVFAIMASTLMVLPVTITIIVVAVINIVTIIMSAGSITQVEIDADITSISILNALRPIMPATMSFTPVLAPFFRQFRLSFFMTCSFT